MDEKERYERIRELNSRKGVLVHNLAIYEMFGLTMFNNLPNYSDIPREPLTEDYVNSLKSQIDTINAKLFLLGQ